MKKTFRFIALSLGTVLISACAPVPITQACNHMDQNLTAVGYLIPDKFYGDPNAVGGFEDATLWLFEQPNVQSATLLIHLAPDSGHVGTMEDFLQNVCKGNPACTLDGKSRFKISGHIFSTPMADCKLKVTQFEDMQFEPQ